MQNRIGSIVQAVAWLGFIRKIPLDVGWFILLIGGYALALSFRFDRSATLVVFLVACAAIAAYIRFSSSRARWLLVCVAISAIVVAPTVLAIYLRHSTVPYQFIHDGAVQTEEATKLFLAGKNPYVENYFGTPLESWWIPGLNELANPALYHLAYLPLVFVFPAPFYLAAQVALGWFDLRFVLLPLFLVTLILLPRFTASLAKQRALVLLFALNALVVPFVVEGRNDAFVLFWLVLSVVLLRARHPVASAAAMACACAAKQMAWFAVPLYALYLFETYLRAGAPDWATMCRRAILPCAVFLTIFGALMLPYLLWDSNAFVEDVLRYPAGWSENPYPISSLGFGGIALAMGWIPSNTAPFPFERLQLLFGIPALVVLLKFLHNRVSISRLWLCCGILTFVISFFSHVFNDNYLGYILNLGVLGIFADA